MVNYYICTIAIFHSLHLKVSHLLSDYTGLLVNSHIQQYNGHLGKLKKKKKKKKKRKKKEKKVGPFSTISSSQALTIIYLSYE